MKFYVLLNDDIIIQKTKQDAESTALAYFNDPTIKYIEYGIINYDDWCGFSTIAVLKGEE